MDMERKYPTREVDGVDVPQMGIKELIKQLGSALETMEGNRKSYTSPEEIEAGTLMVALFGNSLYYMRLFDKSLRTFEAAQDAVLEEQLQQADTVGGKKESFRGKVPSSSPGPPSSHLPKTFDWRGGRATGGRCAAFCIQR